MSLDSGSISNYISNREAHSFNSVVQPEEGNGQLKIVDGSKVQAQGYVSFRLWCVQYNSEVIVRVFPNRHQPLILEIPWLKQKKSPHRLETRTTQYFE